MTSTSTIRSRADRLHVSIPACAMTLEGFREWATSADFPEHIRAAFLDNEVFLDMSNEDPRTHVIVRDEIVSVLRILNRNEDLGELYGDGVLVTNRAAGVSNNPDGSFYYWESLEAGRVCLVPRASQAQRYREIEGTPDWVLEVVSDSSEQKDTERLRKAYHRAGIAEYWLVDARDEEVVFLILHRRKRGYIPAPEREGWQKSRVFGREFRLTRHETRMGHFDFTLELR